MASYKYRVTTATNGVQMAHGLGDVAWTHANATAWARGAGRTLPEGTTIRIERRVSSDSRRAAWATPWLPHRAYIVGPDGIVRRTDR